MVVEERIEAADRRKVDGNELFKEGKIAEAMQQYEMVITLSISCILTNSSHERDRELLLCTFSTSAR